MDDVEPRGPRILDVSVRDLRPFDMLDEGRIIRAVTFHDSGPVDAVTAVLQGQELSAAESGGIEGLVMPEWSSPELLQFDGHETVRVVRGVPVPIRRLALD
jgi:hypothetical protein